MSLLNYVPSMLSCPTSSHSSCLTSSRDICALVSYVPHTLHAVVPCVPRAVRALVSHVPRALRGLVPEVPCASCAFVNYLLLMYSRAQHVSFTSGVSCPTCSHASHAS